jgi:hypothetical protein
MERKNHYLEKFLLISEAELLNFEVGDFQNLESFYDCREKILNIVRHVEKQLEKLSHQFGETAVVDGAMRARAKAELDLKDELVNRILEMDLRLISCIEAAKSKIIQELQSIKKGKKVVAGYKAELGPKYTFNEEA